MDRKGHKNRLTSKGIFVQLSNIDGCTLNDMTIAALKRLSLSSPEAVFIKAITEYAFCQVSTASYGYLQENDWVNLSLDSSKFEEFLSKIISCASTIEIYKSYIFGSYKLGGQKFIRPQSEPRSIEYRYIVDKVSGEFSCSYWRSRYAECLVDIFNNKNIESPSSLYQLTHVIFFATDFGKRRGVFPDSFFAKEILSSLIKLDHINNDPDIYIEIAVSFLCVLDGSYAESEFIESVMSSKIEVSSILKEPDQDYIGAYATFHTLLVATIFKNMICGCACINSN